MQAAPPVRCLGLRSVCRVPRRNCANMHRNKHNWFLANKQQAKRSNNLPNFLHNYVLRQAHHTATRNRHALESGRSKPQRLRATACLHQVCMFAALRLEERLRCCAQLFCLRDCARALLLVFQFLMTGITPIKTIPHS